MNKIKIGTILTKMISANDDILSCNNGLEALKQIRILKKEPIECGVEVDIADEIMVNPIPVYCRFLRKEVKIQKKIGEESPVLILLSEAQINDDHTFTGFIQNIEVEFFKEDWL